MLLKGIDMNALPSVYRKGGKYYTLMKDTIERIDNDSFEKAKEQIKDYNHIVGDTGERNTSNLLAMKGFYIINNVYIPYKNKFMQIDFIAFHRTNRYVVVGEVKNYDNAIEVVDKSYNASKWVVRYKDRVKKFNNPIYQIRAHIAGFNRCEDFTEYTDKFVYALYLWLDGKMETLNVDSRVITGTKGYISIEFTNEEINKLIELTESFSSNYDLMKCIHICSL